MAFADLTPSASVTLERRGVPVLGEREARLLEAVERVHSLKEAAREAGISYRTAWGTIQVLEQALGRPMVQLYRALRQRLEAELARARD